MSVDTKKIITELKNKLQSDPNNFNINRKIAGIYFQNKDFVYPTIGFSFEYDYNYYNKRGLSLSVMSLYDNSQYSDNSYYLFDFEFFSDGTSIHKKIDNIKFYFHRNFANSNDINSNNENIMVGGILEFNVIKSLKLSLNYQNVFYDYNEDSSVNDVKTITAEFKYEINK